MTESERPPSAAEGGWSDWRAAASGDDAHHGTTSNGTPSSDTASNAARGRRPVNILPWAAAEPAPARLADRPVRPATRRAPVPPSRLFAAPGPAGTEDPLAALPPWLPPVRRPVPGVPPAAEPRFGPPEHRPGTTGSGTDRTPSRAGPGGAALGSVSPGPGATPSSARSAPADPPAATDTAAPAQSDESPATTSPSRPAQPTTDLNQPAQPTTDLNQPAQPTTDPIQPAQLTAEAIRHEKVVRPDQQVPRIGWRAAVHTATRGRINLGVGRAERAHRELLRRVCGPLTGARQIAVSSIKGGVGKTTVAACLGLTLAEHRGDGVVAVDADPDAGTLADRLSGQTTVTVRELLTDLDQITTLSQFGEYTSLVGRLRVLAGEQDPAVGEALRRDEYQRVCLALARFFDIVITDCGTGLVHSAMQGTLALADQLIVVGTLTVDGASRASKTLDWLIAHGHQRLAEEAVLVLCRDRSSPRVDQAQLREHFRTRCRYAIEIPADPHLYSGGLINPALLAPATREAFLRLAGVVADGFTAPCPTAPRGGIASAQRN